MQDSMDPSRCPLCGRPNGCAIAAGRDPAGCWCQEARFPSGLLDLLAQEARAANSEQAPACVCEECLKAYLERKSDPGA